ncbi:MAG: hypothetical protein ACO1TE_25825 [Prosthecobacter sp.]
MLFWTHIFDLLAKIGGIAAFVAMLILGNPPPPGKMDPVIFGLSFLAGGVVWWVGLRPLSSWLHARVRLGAALSWGQARRASMLFSPVRDLLRWHPLWEVKQLPAEERVAVIEEAMNRLQTERDAEAARWRAAPALSHAFKWGHWVAVILIAVATFGQLPPASWVNEFQARRFDGSYYPMITFLVLVVPVAGVLRWLEHATGARSVTLVSNPDPQQEGAAEEFPAASASPASSPAATSTPLVEKDRGIDPNDHSRFAPPPGLVKPRGE